MDMSAGFEQVGLWHPWMITHGMLPNTYLQKGSNRLVTTSTATPWGMVWELTFFLAERGPNSCLGSTCFTGRALQKVAKGEMLVGMDVSHQQPALGWDSRCEYPWVSLGAGSANARSSTSMLVYRRVYGVFGQIGSTNLCTYGII